MVYIYMMISMIQNHQLAPDCFGDLVQIEQHLTTNQRLTVFLG